MTCRPAVSGRVVLAVVLVSVAGTPGGAYPRADWSSPVDTLDVPATMRAIDTIRHALPDGWKSVDIRWNTVPEGWHGADECVLVRVEDATVFLRNPGQDFEYHPFYKLWLLPPGWEGRMEVAAIDPDARPAVYLGECADFRVLVRTLGGTTWAEAPEDLGHALGLEIFPLSHRPEHRLDVPAMQRLFQRLDAAAPDQLDRWRQRIYGIAELDHLLYLELLTWEERPTGRDRDPTSLGDVAEKETRFLSREALAAFPGKRGLYLRRVTRRSISDIIVVNPGFAGS
jgi:hypothetical protein